MKHPTQIIEAVISWWITSNEYYGVIRDPETGKYIEVEDVIKEVMDDLAKEGWSICEIGEHDQIIQRMPKGIK